MEVEKPDGVVTSTSNSTTEVDATDGVEARTSTTKVDATDGVDSKTDKGKRSNSVDYLSPGEEELIELRNRMKANREAKAKAKDNLVFEMNEPNNENSMPADNVKGDTFEEHDIYMNQLLKSLNTADKDGITEDPFIYVGEKYVSVAQFKECLTYYTLETGFSLWYERSGEVRVVAKYGQRPPRLSALEKEDEHTCVRNFNFGSLVNYKWITKVFGEKIRANPDIRLCDIADLVMKKYKCKVSPTQCTNAKKYALTEYEKTVGEHYAMLRSYGKALLDSNLRSTIKLGVTVNPDGKTYFDRFYVCFAGLADDGRQVVNVENKDNWTWFLKLLEQDLGSSRGNRLTLMSDKHKGLIEVVKYVMPNAEHGQCARHIYENFRKQYPGLKFTQLFWAISKASYTQLFNKVMDKIKSCEAIKNGFSECFNSVIVNVRYTPLLTILEAIRVIVLERMNKMREISRKWNPGVCPNIKKRLEWLKEQQSVMVGLRRRARWSRVREVGDVGSRGGASGSRGGSSVSRGVVGGSRGGSSVSGGASGSTGRGAGGSGGASGSRGRGASGSGGASGSRGRGVDGSKRKPVSTAETQKRQGKKKVGTSGFAKWFRLQDEPKQTRDEPHQTHHEPVQTQDEDQVEQTQEQAEIDLTQMEQTQEQTHDQVQPQEQPQQAALRMPSARILQRKLRKQGSSQNTALNVE
ncbi:multidrug resistance-associated protein 5 [Tanacetum coccineum]